MIPTEREQILRNHFLVSTLLANMLQTNSSIAHGIIADNRSLANLHTIKLELQIKELLEYVQKLGESKEES